MLISQESLGWSAIALSVVTFLFYVSWVKTAKGQPITLPNDTTPVARAERFILEHRKKQESQQAGVQVEKLVWMRQVALACDILCIALSGFLFGWVISCEDASTSVLLAKASMQVSTLASTLSRADRRTGIHLDSSPPESSHCNVQKTNLSLYAPMSLRVSANGILRLAFG